MSETAIALEAPADVVEALMGSVTGPDFEWSEPIAVTSVADALDSPIGGEEVRQGLELAILVFKTGTAALAFAKATYDVLQRGMGATIVVKDPFTGNTRGTITGQSTIEEVRSAVAQ